MLKQIFSFFKIIINNIIDYFFTPAKVIGNRNVDLTLIYPISN
jgi:hypothetical protein